MTHRWMFAVAPMMLLVVGVGPHPTPAHASRHLATAVAAKKPRLSRGMKVGVGGYKLWIKCVGKGSPTVVLDTALGFGGQTAWYAVSPRVAKFDHVCIYDHAGVERSDRRPQGGNTTVKLLARELHTLLTNAHVAPPYVMGAWADGGYIVRMFTYTHRSEVAGMVLADTQNESSCDLSTYSSNPCGPAPADTPERFDIQKSFAQLDAVTHGVIKGSLGALPLVVVSHGVPFSDEGNETLFQRMQVNLATASSNSVHVIATNSDHTDILVEQPRLVTEAIRQVVAAARGPTHQLPPCGRSFTKRGGKCASP